MKHVLLRCAALWLLLACSSREIELGGGRPQPAPVAVQDSGPSDASAGPATGDAAAPSATPDAGSFEPMAVDLDAGEAPDARASEPEPPVELGEAPDPSCTGEVFDRHVYWFCTDNHDWDAAQSACRAVGAELVSVQSSREQAFLEQHAGAGQWIVGARRIDGELAWPDGSALVYTHWDSGQPGSLDCVVIDDGFWRTDLCIDDEKWICER